MNLTVHDLALPELDLDQSPDRMACPAQTRLDCPTVTLMACPAQTRLDCPTVTLVAGDPSTGTPAGDLADHQAELRRLMN